MRPAEYRKYARECLTAASKARTEEDKQALMEMSRTWTQAALQMEGLGSTSFIQASGEAPSDDAR